jgi:glycosyltransferase involved in cell wall biosynthesis
LFKGSTLTSLQIKQKQSVKLAIVVTVPITLGFYRGQIEHLQKRGFDIVVISSPGKELVDFGIGHKVEVHAVDMERGISLLHDPIALIKMTSFFLRTRPDIVHGSTAKAALLSMLAASAARIPIQFYTVRGLMTETSRGAKRCLLGIIERITCACASRVLVNSRSVLDGLLAGKFCARDKMVMLNSGSSNGIDGLGRFNPNSLNSESTYNLRQEIGLTQGHLVIGFVGRLATDKGFHELVSAWKMIREDETTCCLLIIGSLDSRDPIPKDLLNTLRADPRVHMFDWIDNIDMPYYYSIMNLLVLPTYREGFPNVLLEASAMELPVVATRVTGCVDAVVDGVTGTLVPASDPKALYNAIIRYLNDPGLRKKHGKAGRQRVLRDFRPEDIWEALYQEYIRLMKEKGIPFVPRNNL